jgi:hypothetical protein
MSRERMNEQANENDSYIVTSSGAGYLGVSHVTSLDTQGNTSNLSTNQSNDGGEA